MRYESDDVMKINFILPHAGSAGGIRVIAIYAERLQKLGHEVTVISTPKAPLTVRSFMRTLIKKRKWPISRRQVNYFEKLDVAHHVIDRVRPIIDSDVPDGDVVVATWWET